MGAEAVSVARRSLLRGRDPFFLPFEGVRDAPLGALRPLPGRGPSRLCGAMDAVVEACAALATRAGRRGDASAACASLSDPKATANMVRTNTSFLYIDSVPRSSYQ